MGWEVFRLMGVTLCALCRVPTQMSPDSLMGSYFMVSGPCMSSWHNAEECERSDLKFGFHWRRPRTGGGGGGA